MNVLTMSIDWLGTLLAGGGGGSVNSLISPGNRMYISLCSYFRIHSFKCVDDFPN